MNGIYFDNAATGFPKSDGVFEAIKTAYYGCGNGGRGGHALAVAASRRIYACREALAALLGTEAENTVLCGGATLALNMAIKGLINGGEVLCSVMEHNAVLRPLYALAASGKIKLCFFAPSFESDEKTIAAALEAMPQKPTAVVLTHASNVTGMCLPVKRIFAEARRRGALCILDAAQTVGHTRVDFENTGADVICLAGHKGLYGPLGTGALAVRRGASLRFASIIEGGTGVATKDRQMPPRLPERLESGSADITGIAGLEAAIRELKINEKREKSLRLRLKKGMAEIIGVKLYGAESSAAYMPLLAFNLGKNPSERVAEELSSRGFYLRGGLHCAPLAHSALGSGKYGALRISLGRSNTEAECDSFLNALEDIKNLQL